MGIFVGWWVVFFWSFLSLFLGFAFRLLFVYPCLHPVSPGVPFCSNIYLVFTHKKRLINHFTSA